MAENWLLCAHSPNLLAADTMNLIKLALVALLMTGSAQAWAQTYYKWTDDNGTVHFTADPPEDRAYEAIDTAGNVIARRDSSDAEADSDTAEQDGDNEVQMPREAEPDPELIAARCTQARENMYWLENRRRITVDRADGTEEFVEGDDRLRMIEETQAFIDEWCDEQQ